MTGEPKIEICVEGVDGVVAAQRAGADRVELCASLVEGGVTPSLGVVRQALAVAAVPVQVIVRPRGGDFLYSDNEFASMVADVEGLRELGVAGVVFGCLTQSGHIDERKMNTLVAAAGPLSVTCHRAFDMTPEVGAAVAALVRCGVARILTSGQRDSAVEGLPVLRATVAAAGGRIKILACGGLDESNIRRVWTESGADELHFAAPREVASPMAFRNPHVGMGGDDRDREYRRTVTDEATVRRTIAAVRGPAA